MGGCDHNSKLGRWGVQGWNTMTRYWYQEYHAIITAKYNKILFKWEKIGEHWEVPGKWTSKGSKISLGYENQFFHKWEAIKMWFLYLHFSTHCKLVLNIYGSFNCPPHHSLRCHKAAVIKTWRWVPFCASLSLLTVDNSAFCCACKCLLPHSVSHQLLQSAAQENHHRL